jgi:hypothetical protein
VKWWRVDRYYWRSDLDYKICWSPGSQDEPQFLAWAPRNPDDLRSPGELLNRVGAVGTFAAARQLAEDHAAAQGVQDVG